VLAYMGPMTSLHTLQDEKFIRSRRLLLRKGITPALKCRLLANERMKSFMPYTG
jgi:hypothetical protein